MDTQSTRGKNENQSGKNHEASKYFKVGPIPWGLETSSPSNLIARCHGCFQGIHH